MRGFGKHLQQVFFSIFWQAATRGLGFCLDHNMFVMIGFDGLDVALCNIGLVSVFWAG